MRRCKHRYIYILKRDGYTVIVLPKMYNINRVRPGSYKEFEAPKQDSRKTSIASETQEIKFMCPLHGEITDGRPIQHRVSTVNFFVF